MSETTPNLPLVRTYTTNFPIRACRLRRDDLKRLYRIINDRQIAYRQTVLNQLSQLPNESSEQFEARRIRVGNAFTTTVNITGANQEVESGQHESFFDTSNIPENILTVFYTTIAGLEAIGLAAPQQEFRTTLLLDFSRPTALDFSKLPTLATENASYFAIFSASESWFSALHKRLTDLFNER